MVRSLNPQLHGRGGAGNDQALQTWGMAYSKPSPKHSSPGVPEQVEIILDAEVLQELLELCQEQLLCPEGRIATLFWEVSGLPISELVVKDDGDAVGAGQVGEGKEVVVDDAGATV